MNIRYKISVFLQKTVLFQPGQIRELQKNYQELLKKKDDYISESLLIVSKLANNGK
jgi:hypothetical protein